MRGSINRAAAAAIAAVLCGGIVMPCTLADSTYVYIANAADLKDLSEKCMIDSYSADKVVVLDADIDVSGTGFTYIPFFSGTFEGNGHTISGITIEVTNPERGFIGTVGETGTIKELNLNCTITEDESAKEDKNSTGDKVLNIIEELGDGRIASTVDRFIKDTGIYTVGGIAGLNRGMIRDCSFNGSVRINKNVGGIAGVNEGRIEGCTNYGAIISEENTGGIAGKNTGVIRWCKNNGRINDNAVEGMYATGGIAGYSEGVIDSCDNNGEVGYKNTGSATGGICGAQSGRINECHNLGAVYGKKRVGGIVGNFEPYTNITYNSDMIWDSIDEGKERLRGDLDELRDRFDESRRKIKDDLDDFDERLKKFFGIDEITDAIKDANDNFSTLTDSLSGLNDTLSDRIANGRSLESIADSLARLEDSLSDNADDVSDFLVEARNSAKTISDTAATVSDSLSRTNSSLSGVLDTVNGDLNDSERRKQIDDAIDSVDKALDSTSRAMDNLAGLRMPSLNVDLLEDSDSQMAKIIRKFNNEYSGILEPFAKINEDLSNGIDVLRERRETLQELRDKLDDMLKDTLPTIAPISTSLPVNEAAMGGLFITAHAADKSDKTTLERLLDLDIHDVDISLKRNICGEEFEMAVVRYSINDAEVSGTSDIGGISGGVGFGVMIGGSFANINSDGKEFSLNPSTAIKSVITGCINEGDITAKTTSAGGITGFSDLGKVKDSINSGDITVTDGSYAGGVTGYNLNEIRRCINTGDVDAESDIGGIAGYGKNIAQCYALTRTASTGERRGAIAGSVAGTIENNYFLKERLGGVNGVDYSGKAQSVAKEVLAVDGDMSPELSGLEPRYFTGTSGDLYMPQLRAFTENTASYSSEMLRARSAYHARFRFTASFDVDGQIIKTINVDYGEKLPSDEIPQIPKVGGKYGEWDKDVKVPIIRNTRFKAVYNKSKTTLSYGGEPAQILVEGDFNPTAELVVDEFNPAAVVDSSKYEAVAGYGFMVLQNGEKYDGEMRVRVRVPKDAGEIKIGLVKENSIVIADSEADGHYRIFSSGGAERFIVLKTRPNLLPYIMIGILLLAALVLLFLLRKRIRERRLLKALKGFADKIHFPALPAATAGSEERENAGGDDRKPGEQPETAEESEKTRETERAEDMSNESGGEAGNGE